MQFEDAWVPAIWPFEVINIQLVAERRNRLTAVQAEAFLETLTELPIRVQNIEWPGKISSLLMRGRSIGLTAYDCAYIDLALRMGYPFSTQDKKIREVEIHLDIPLL